MRVIQTKVLRGPNVWSNYRKNLIVVDLDLEEFNEVYTDEIVNFSQRLKQLIPSLHEHHCSLKKEGGFFERVDRGTLLGHVMEHVALEIQTLVGMECGYGRVRESNKLGIFHVVFSYQIEKAGLRAAEMALEIVTTLAHNQDYKYLEDNLNELRNIFAAERLGPSTEALVNEARAREIPVTFINDQLIQLGYGKNQRIISATMDNQTSCIGTDLVADKKMTKEVLQSQYIPVPTGAIVHTQTELEEQIDLLGFPLVIKPRFGNHGRGITTSINTKKKAIEAFHLAKKESSSIIVERFIEGSDFRFLVIDYKLVAVAKRVPAEIIGDGCSTIQELIDEVNRNPHRGTKHENILTSIKIDEITLSILEENELNLDRVLPKNKKLCLKHTANISTGGTALDVTETVHPHNVFLAERIARLVNLNICGIDIIAADIAEPMDEHNAAVLEVNAAPGIRMHLSPSMGKKRNVAKPIVNMMFPRKDAARIPIIAVTGTNGKTTVVKLIGHIAHQAGKNVGMATTEGLYIQNKLIYEGDCSGPRSASDILRDPIVDFAVLECARGGILRSGLGFDHCSTSILTNISEDHLGQDDIETLEELAKVKSVVPHSTLNNGYAILNADNELSYALRKDLVCRIALFGLKKNKAITEHCKQGGIACFIEDDCIYISDNNQLILIAKMSEVPLSFKGKARSMQYNILTAVLACWVNHFKAEEITQGLMDFYPTPENLPGRLNLFKFKYCQVLVDYAHNEEAYIELNDYLSTIKVKKKIAIVAGTGDRKEKDIKNTGYYAAQVFDEIIIRQDKDARGRTHKEISDLIIEGIKGVDRKVAIKIIPNEFDAIDYAIEHASPGTFIWHFPDTPLESVNYLKKKVHQFLTNYTQSISKCDKEKYAET
jgi:cyanophycin synthetase